MHQRIASLFRDESGATSTEYALFLTLITMAIFGAVTAFGIAVGDLFDLPPGVFP